MNLRELAKHQDCQVRLPGVCNFNPETTVLAHIRRGGVAGMGQKPHDLIGVWACSACHDCIDGRRKYPDGDCEAEVLAALCRTLARVSRELGI